MSEPIDDLCREYVSALSTFVETRDERTLSRAYELGRRAMSERMGILDMAMLHQAAISSIVIAASPAMRAPVADAAGAFFHELLSPFEMSFRGYQSANDELRRLNETLRQQKETVEFVNRELESFSYSVSHDLRTPLRGIAGFSQILIEEYAGMLDAEGMGYLRRVHESTQRMDQLIQDLLGLAQVTSAEIDRSSVDVTALVCRIADRLRSTAPNRECEFTIESAVRAHGDVRLLGILFENLLGNAWKFTSKRARALIAFGRDLRNGVTTYFVRDNGAGFDMAFADRLFGAFQRLHSTAEFEGTGIGLATVLRIVRRHGGQVWADGAPDVGATIYFTLGSDGEP